MQAMYEETNQLVEKITRIIHDGMINWGIPLFTLPKAVISYINYFTTDAGNAAFVLPFHIG